WRARADNGTNQFTRIGAGVSVSPDGRFLLSVSNGPKSFVPGIYLQETAGGPVRHICDGYSPKISPDGKKIVYVCPSTIGLHEIRLRDLESSAEEVLDNSPGLKTGPEFSRDGSRVAFKRLLRPRESDEIRVIALRGRAVRTIEVPELKE